VAKKRVKKQANNIGESAMSAMEFAKRMEDIQRQIDQDGSKDEAALKDQAIALTVEVLRSTGYGVGATAFTNIMAVFA
jgi:hypothetical protein